jgi:hypothetical protein
VLINVPSTWCASNVLREVLLAVSGDAGEVIVIDIIDSTSVLGSSEACL